MFQNYILAVQQGRKKVDEQRQIARLLAPQVHIDFKSILQQSFSTIGFVAVVLLLSMFLKPELAEKFSSLSPFFNSNEKSLNVTPLAQNVNLPSISQDFSQSITAPSILVDFANESKLTGDQRQQQLVTNWLSKRYRVANEAIAALVSASYQTAREAKLDPLLILSVIAIESRFNPFSESPVGAQGLMQVMSKIHQDKFANFGGIKAALNPVANIKVGSMILKDYVTSTGSIEGGLKRYVGAADNETDGGYGALVLAEYQRLKDVAAGKVISTFVVTPKPVAAIRPQETGAKTEDGMQDKSNERVQSEQVAET